MIPKTDIYTDFQGLAQLRADVRADGNSAAKLREVAGQFEALFTQMVLKNMREAKLADGLYASDQEEQYLGMFDAQLALQLSRGSGLGLKDMLVRQLGGAAGIVAPRDTEDSGRGVEPSREKPVAGNRPADMPATEGPGRSPSAFASSLWPHARKAAGRLGVAPEVLVAQAALETGWGKSVPQHPDGRTSHNVFGIKAGPGWSGERVSVPTLEYEDGVAVRRPAEFRSYASLDECFADYARLLTNAPRYRQALEQSGDSARFAQALARAGFATDPAYAQKINAILDGGTLATSVAALKISSAGPLT